MRTSNALIQKYLHEISFAQSLTEAARPLQAFGRAIGLERPAVVEDYTVNKLLEAEDGRTLAEIFGWEHSIINRGISNKLRRVDPIGHACRIALKPFVWDAVSVTAMVMDAQPHSHEVWHLTPERGVAGGFSVPVHMPLCRTGGVTWVSFDKSVSLQAVESTYGNSLRLAAMLFMDRVYLARAESRSRTAKIPLTERELECLTWVALGKSDIEIGMLIGRAATTARFHVSRAMERLGATNRAQAVAIAAQLGLISALG